MPVKKPRTPVAKGRRAKKAGVCCSCGYAGSPESICPSRKDGTHCVHWWDGPELPQRRAKGRVMDNIPNTGDTSMDIVPPTCADLFDMVGMKCVQRNPDPSWRHGTRERDIYLRESDGTYWAAAYRLSTDAETDELRDGDATISRVYPHKVEAIEYRSEPA